MALPANVTTGTWTLDPSHSEIGFTVRHAGISKVRGQFTDAAATLDLAENVTDSKVNASIKTASFDSGDANRDGHVRGEDFFDVETFPEISFVSNTIVPKGDAYELQGDLTIKGITRPVALETEFNGVAVDPVRQHPRRPQRRNHHQPQGLRPDLERRPRSRRRAGQRQGCHQPGTGLHRSRSIASIQHGRGPVTPVRARRPTPVSRFQRPASSSR